MLRSDRGYITLGLLLFTAYLLQHLFNFRWEEMLLLQQQEWYKLSSGIVLLLLILVQWYFSRVRANPTISTEKSFHHYNLHKWVGALSPLVFYLHAVSPGYAYLLVLTILFFGNLIIGLLNAETVPIRARWFFQVWMVLHISISCLITSLVLIHIGMVFYYE